MKLLNEASEMTSVQALTPHPRNVNVANVDAIAESIHESGFWGGIVAQRSTGYILAGNHRYQAAVQLGATEIPVHWVEISDKAALKILLADNQIASLAHRDEQSLADLLSELQLTDTLTGTGYVDADLDALIASIADNAPAPEPVEAPEPQIDRAEELRAKWGTERGQLWLIPSRTVPGKSHRLLCGDSTNAEDVKRLMDGQLACAVLTDPPYGINQPGVTNDEPEKLDAIVQGAVDLLPIKDGVIVAFQSTRTFPKWLDVTRQAGFKFERMLWMYKAAQMAFPWRGWILKSESILVSTIGTPQWQETHPYSHDCYYLSEVSGELAKDAGWHGSVKPIKVVSDLATRISPPGGLIHEPFLGSGTTMAACENTGRLCYGMEFDRNFIAVILERLSGMGLAPELQPPPE